jgi:uncharacterized membrane protein YjgN (DUF898 family)
MDHQHRAGAAEESRAITFTGHWREFLPIAATNVLLIIVTLGIYRFWAAARERRYLWSRTRVIDDRLEWSGTGLEMFLGFLLVIGVLLPFFLFIQFAFPALIARGQEGLAGLLFLVFYVGIFFLVGLANFRATRYRLSRTWWHGIRGGSDDSGMRFAANYVGRYVLCFLTGFLAFPWATTSLWNKRWEKMSFGPYAFQPYLSTTGLWRRWLFLYALPVLMVLVLAIGGAAAFGLGAGGEPDMGAGIGMAAVGIFAIFYLAIPLATLHWYAKYFRNAAGTLTLGDLQFGFEARTRDWLMLFLGNLALAIVTLGLGMAFWTYRNWAFMVRHVRLYGEVDLSQLTQSSTRAPKESEGFADAFDMGAI